MGWISNIWETAKKTVGNIGHAVSNWSKGVFTAPSFTKKYHFCGPGNPLDDEYVSKYLPNASASDRACYQHDKDYENFKKLKDKGDIGQSELNQLVRESDDRLISNLKKSPDRDIGSYLSQYGITAKKMLEDWGVINPDLFVT